jgi:hypothetical protein
MLPENALPHIAPPPALPTLTVNAQGRLYLHPSLIERLGLTDKQPINLYPPDFNSRYWVLDLRPEAGRRISLYRGQRPRVEGVRLPQGLIAADQPLTLCLPLDGQYYPNLYILLPQPDAVPAQYSAPPLAA